MPSRREQVEKKVIAALLAAGVPSGSAIRADQRGPRPDLPYLTVKVIGDRDTYAAGERVDGISGADAIMHGEIGRRATVSVQGFGEGAYTWIDGFRLRLLRDAVRAAALPVSLRVLGPPSDLSGMLDTAIEARSMITVEAGYTATDSDEPETLIEVDTVEVTKSDDLAWVETYTL